MTLDVGSARGDGQGDRAATPGAAVDSASDPGTPRYDAFISYSHAADGKLTPALQSALHRLGKPWYRRRALHVFRDETSLAVTPALWPTICEALAASGHFLLLASPEAAQSHWVQQEVEWWLTHRSPRTLFVVLTDGTLVWDDSAGNFDWARTDALPTTLKGAFNTEPLWVDLRWAKQETHVSQKDPRFQDAIATLAAPLHGRPKEDLIGEDVRQHQRAVTLVRGAVTILVGFVILLAIVSAFALIQRNEALVQTDVANKQTTAAVMAQATAETEAMVRATSQTVAEEQRTIAQSRQLAAQAESLFTGQLDLGLLLSVEAYRKRDTAEALGSLLDGRYANPTLVRFLGPNTSVVESVAFSPDGQRLASGSLDRTIRLWDVSSGQPLTGHTGAVQSVTFSPDGQRLASGSSDQTIRLWDVASGQPIGQPLTGHTSSWWSLYDRVGSVAFSPDGLRLASGSSEGNIGTILLWDIGPGSPSVQACRRANRNLTRSEWTRYLPDVPYRPTCPGLPVPSE